MKVFRAFVKKEMFHILRDARTLILLFAVPVVLVLLFGFAITREIRNAEIAIQDLSHDAATRAITDKIDASQYFTIVGQTSTVGEIEDLFKSGDIKLALVFPENFNGDLSAGRPVSVQILLDAGDPNIAGTLKNYLLAIIADYRSSLGLGQLSQSPVQMEVRMLYNPRLDSAYYFVPGVITVIITLVSSMMTSVTIAREKEFGTMEILLVSPLKPAMIVLGKSVPYVFIALFNTLVVLVIGYFVFSMPLNGSLFLLAAECLLFVINALALGLLISALVDTQRLALMISLLGMFLPTLLLSGFIFPIESMPAALQYVSHIIPAKWFVIIIKGIMLKGVGFSEIAGETIVLGGMTAVFLTLSVKFFKIRLE